VAVVLALVVVQIALGGWVSTNYAVLACQGFPTCQGQWWPSDGLPSTASRCCATWARPGQGGALPFDALVAIHMAHRLFAVVVVLAALVALAWRCTAAVMRQAAPHHAAAVRAAGAGNWPAGCRTWCWAGRSWLRWHTAAGAAGLVAAGVAAGRGCGWRRACGLGKLGGQRRTPAARGRPGHGRSAVGLLERCSADDPPSFPPAPRPSVCGSSTC
jgi:hypothetical protein